MSPSKYNQKEFAKFQAENLMKQLQESVRIVNTTSNARAFFGRLKFSLEVLSELQKYEKYRFFKNSSPTADYNKIISNLEATVDNFIDRAIEENKKKLNGYKTDAAKSRNYKKFVEDLLDDFEMADTFWSGNNMYPPYKGILYTSANYQRVKKMYDDLFVIEVSKKAEIEENNTVYTNVQNSSFAKYGGMEAELMTIDLMEGHDFEHWCAGALKKMGFSNVEVTPASGDHGVDVLAQKDGIKYAIQCKRYSHDLGNTPIQEVHAGKSMYNCHVGAVITNQHFTEGAKQLAKATGVLLWDREWIKSHLESVDNSIPAQSNHDSPYEDEMFSSAVDIILETGSASVSTLQRRLNLGYAQAARIVDEMEECGIVGPFQGSKPRSILIAKEEWDIRMGRIRPKESMPQVINKASPDINRVDDRQTGTVMVELPEPTRADISKYATPILCFLSVCIPFVKVALERDYINGGYAEIITAIICVILIPLLITYLCIFKKPNGRFYQKWWFWLPFFLFSFFAK